MAEPFATVPEAILEEILLRLPSWASLVRAALVSKNWCVVISKAAFLTRYRELHPSSPLLGFFFSDRLFGLPAFRLAGAVRSDPDLRAVQRGADLLLADLKQDSGWRIRDSRNGHLLLCRAGESGGDSFSVYNPVSRRLITIRDRPHDQVGNFADCLLDVEDSFRMVSVQQHRGSIRAVEYDPAARKWRSHPLESPWALNRPKKLRPWCLEPMQAAGLIFWRYSAALALVLDCSSMHFSTCPVPCSCYAIGEVEDGVGCLVCLDDPTNLTTHGVLKVWLLNNTGGGTITWELTGKSISVKELLGPDTRVCQVVLVSNGLALISMDDRYDQFVIDLNKMSLHAEFDFRGRAYPYQMEWPPAGLPALQEEAHPVQLVLPVEPAAPLHDVDHAAPFDDVGVAAPLDDVAYTGICAQRPSAVVVKPLQEHVIAVEVHNLVGTVEDGVRLMETDAATPSAHLVKGMTLSSSTPVVPHANLGALSTQQPTTALDEHLHEDASVCSNWFCTTCPGECHKSTCPQHAALPTKPRCEGVVSIFRVDPPLVPAPCFPPMSPASNNHSPTQFFNEATYTQKLKSEAMYTQKVKNSEELPDMEGDELDHTHTPVDEDQNLNQRHESLTAVQLVSTLADPEGPLAVTQRERRIRQESKRYRSCDWVLR